MATSTFGQKFAVKPEKVTEFVNEMSRAVTPTLRKDFHSNSVHLSQEENLRDKLQKALSRR